MRLGWTKNKDGMRGFITTQPIKTLKVFLQEWCLSDDGWTLDGDNSGKKYKISELDDELDKDKIFYKMRWSKEEGIIHTDKGDKKQNDPKRFIKTDHATKEGEVAEISTSYIDHSIIKDEEKYDGFYAVYTNLDDSIGTIVKANKRRWEIEECFRIMKTDFEARPGRPP